MGTQCWNNRTTGFLSGSNFASPWHSNLDSGDDQKSAEHVDHPVKILKQSGAGCDKNRSHDQRTDNPPEKHPMLIDGGGREILKNHEKNEEIIDTERFLDDVAGKEFSAFSCPQTK